jgi:hypothetical protein
MDYFRALATEKCPKAAAAGRIRGTGAFLLLSCEENGSRHVIQFNSPDDRARLASKWAGGEYPGQDSHCPATNCMGDHPTLDLKLETQPSSPTPSHSQQTV